MHNKGVSKRTRAVAYLRVSTSKQADRGVSLDAQRAKVRAYAELYDLDLVAVVEDAGATAANLDRPGLQEALMMLRKRKADALLVVKLDRLTRSVRDLGTVLDLGFRKGKLRLLSVSEQLDTGSAAGRMVMNMLAVIGEWEREAIGERTSAAMQHMRAEGAYTGGAVPYGWALAEAGSLRSVESEQAVIRTAHELRSKGLSLRAVGAKLAQAGLRTRRGRKFDAQQIRRMLLAPGRVQNAA